MTQKQAHRRYMKLFVPSMFFYVLSMIGIKVAKQNGTMPDVLLYGLALVPAVFVLIWIWGHMRYITDLDEYLQGLQVRAVMVGIGMVMVVATVWGLLEQLTDVSPLPIFYIVPVFYFAYGAAHIVIMKRAGIKGMCL